jgi:glycerol dehydrogenase
MTKKNLASTETSTATMTLSVAPAQVWRGDNALAESGDRLADLGKRPLVVGGNQTLELIKSLLNPVCQKQRLTPHWQTYQPDCSENSLNMLLHTAKEHQADLHLQA